MNAQQHGDDRLTPQSTIRSYHGSLRWRVVLLGLYAGCWLLLAVAPSYRQDWLLENLLVLLAVPLLLAIQRRLSDRAIGLLFLFFMLHAVGAHYTYAEVPYERWLSALFGSNLQDWFGFERNHFDRLVHLLYGLLVTPAAIELLDRRLLLRGSLRYLIPFTFMASHAVIYEIIEWTAAEIFGGELGQAYLGTQGDVWDAQKDSALCLLGVLIAVIWMRRARSVSNAEQ